MAMRLQLTILLLVSGSLFLYRLGDRDLGSSHEARAAQNAQTIVSDGDWGLPRLFNRKVELQKPPLYYWLVAAIAWLRGVMVDAWAVRLPAALAALACVGFVAFLGHRAGRPRVGFLAALMLATAVHFTWLARVGRIDMPLTLTVTLALGGFFLGQDTALNGRRGGWRWFFLGYVGIGFGLLLKGPIAAILPLAVAGVWQAMEWRRTRVLPRRALMTLLWGMPLALLIAAPWFLWANAETDNRLWDVFFWYHNIERGLNGTLVAHPWWFYVPRLFVDFLPWSVLLPVAAWIAVKRRAAKKGDILFFRSGEPALAEKVECPLFRFGLVWFGTMFVFLSLMKFKRGDYLLPAYPGLALWLAGVLQNLKLKPNFNLKPIPKPTAGTPWDTMRPAECQPWAWAGLFLGLAGWWVYIDFIEPRYDDGRVYREFAAEIRHRTDQPVIFFRTEAHEVAFHVGRPLDTILEWENLDWWATRPFRCYIVMPPDCAASWTDHLEQGRLEEVLRTSPLTHRQSRPLVLLRSCRPLAPREESGSEASAHLSRSERATRASPSHHSASR